VDFNAEGTEVAEKVRSEQTATLLARMIAAATEFLNGLSNEWAARAGMVLVPGVEAGRVSGDEDVVVDDVESETAVNMQGRAFVFVESEGWWEMRHYVPKIDDAVADIDAGIEEVDEIRVTDARFGPGVNDGRELRCHVIEEIRGGQRREGAAKAVAGDQEFLAAGSFGLNQLAEIFADRFVHNLKALMNRAPSGNGAIGLGSEIEIIKPVLEEFSAAERYDQPV
jgi:hypothetical protein